MESPNQSQADSDCMCDKGKSLEIAARESPEKYYIPLDHHTRVTEKLRFELMRSEWRHKDQIDSLKAIAGWGFVTIMLLWLGLRYLDPISEFRLINGAQVTVGHLTETGEGEIEDSRGNVRSFDVAVYSFKDPEGKEFLAARKSVSTEIKPVLEVEYLPSDPTVNRVKGDGSQSITQWFLRVFVFGIWYWLSLVCSVGYFWFGIQRFKHPEKLVRGGLE